MKILVVDDSRNERKITRFSFECHGYYVIEAVNGKQGLEKANLEKPSLILSDTLMPVMDGFQLLKAVREHEDLKAVPFIFYSELYVGGKEQELAQEMGATAFIVKPKTADLLFEEVDRIMALVTAGGLPPPVPQAAKSTLPNFTELAATKLEERVRELSEANRSILRLNSELEQRVQDRTSQLEETNSELEMFSFSISHDLRAPLRHLDGFSQVLLEECAGKLNATGREYLDRIMKSSRRMWQMIDGLLDLSRASRGRIVREKVDLSALAQEICSKLAQADPAREVAFRIAEQVTGWGDARMIRAVLEHLLGNAWKFTAFCDDPFIEFFSTEIDQKSVYGVRDNGAGFDMSYADKLFAPFQRLHPKDDFAGSGIGLATVRRILNRHNGKIWVEAEPGKGAVFYFTL